MLEAEDMDENLFYKELTNTYFYSLFCPSSIVCIPHSQVIQGLAITRDIMEAHCFQPSPYFRGQYVGTRQKQKIISLDSHSITTMPGSQFGFKEKRTVHIIAEETYYLNTKRIRILSIDRLLQGEAAASVSQKQAISIPPTRNCKTDLEFLNMFPENHEPIHELQLAVQEFTASYVYIKGYNRTTVERIQHIYTNTCEIILQRNRLLRDSCHVSSEHEQFLELVENVVMGYLHKKIWHQTLKPLLSSQDTFVYHVCLSYTHVTTLAHYSIRYPLSEMSIASFEEAIDQFNQVEQVVTPLEKLAIVKSTLDLISVAVVDYIKAYGNENTGKTRDMSI
ncbi:hypothetical protein K501DRAFT_181955 [Backusella circina FSU 941]|nr:hypothetical protein K501DRAFT_181955 [Backusella circina FSU 941]